jgi:hypothetical protein
MAWYPQNIHPEGDPIRITLNVLDKGYGCVALGLLGGMVPGDGERPSVKIARHIIPVVQTDQVKRLVYTDSIMLSAPFFLGL